MEKVYLAVTANAPKQSEWACRLSLAPDPKQIGRIVAAHHGKPAETEFRVVVSLNGKRLVEARPYTGRQHQIRVHLAQSGCPIIGDELYGGGEGELALRAVGLAYRDPFTRKPVTIRAPVGEFLSAYGFAEDVYRVEFNPPVRGLRNRAD
jgi:23S rRNA-/tRNA-specific pseudouridylate synthase